MFILSFGLQGFGDLCSVLYSSFNSHIENGRKAEIISSQLYHTYIPVCIKYSEEKGEYPSRS